MGQLRQSRSDGSDRAAVRGNCVDNVALARSTWPVHAAADARRDGVSARGPWRTDDVLSPPASAGTRAVGNLSGVRPRGPLDDEQDRLKANRDGPIPIQRTGRWCAGRFSGDYIARAGPRGDYIELHLAQGRFTREHVSRLRSRLDNVSVRRFSGGQRLALLRQTPLLSTPAPESGLDGVSELAVSLQQALPELRLDPDADFVEASVTPQLDQLRTEPVPVLPTSLSTAEPLPRDGTPPLLSLATAALERACFRQAEHFGSLAAATGDTEASNFLEALRAVRRAAKVVRRHPRDPHARLQLAHAYFLGDAGWAAMREATEAVRLDPHLGEAHALIGLEHVYRGERDRAKAACERADDSGEAGPLQQTLLALLDKQSSELPPDAAVDLPLDRPLETVGSRIPHLSWKAGGLQSLTRRLVLRFERIWRRP